MVVVQDNQIVGEEMGMVAVQGSQQAVVLVMMDMVAVLDKWVSVYSYSRDNFVEDMMVSESQDKRRIVEACEMALMLFV